MRRVLPWLLAALAAVVTLPAWSWQPIEQSRQVAAVPIRTLPPEAGNTLQRIQRGEPFPYRKDGTVFHNREQRLPWRPQDYYREFTVPTPNSHDRGARRIIAGLGASGDVRTSGEYFYTGDHYRTFYRIQE